MLIAEQDGAGVGMLLRVVRRSTNHRTEVVASASKIKVVARVEEHRHGRGRTRAGTLLYITRRSIELDGPDQSVDHRTGWGRSRIYCSQATCKSSWMESGVSQAEVEPELGGHLNWAWR